MKMMQLQFGYRKPSANRGGLARRLSALAMSLLLVCSLPLAAFAEEYDLANGSISIEAKADGQYVTQADNNIIDHKEESETVITQKDSSTSTTNTITINAAENTTANVTLKDVNIDTGTSGGAAIQTSGDGNVTIELDGENTVQSGENHAGVEKNNNGNLTITNTDEVTTDDPGSLSATGGRYGAGIGGGKSKDGSDITISGSAKVTANGGHSGAGIGGGNGGTGSDITITGNAEVTAQGGKWGAGIGGGNSKDGSNITISGSAEVTATGGVSGAGIGGGYGRYSSNITVSGDAQVKAQGGASYFDTYYTTSHGAGAAIGNGGGGSLTSSDVSSTLTGKEANVTVDAPEEGTGFGLYVGQLDQGWIAKYQPGADLDEDAPDSLIYQGEDGNITTSNGVQLATDKAPTCTEDGHKGGFQVGDELVGAEILNSLPHDPEHHDAKAPTCEEVGWDSYDTCKRDGCTYSTYVEKDVLGHSFTNYVSNNDATYAKDGTRTAKCDHPGCDATDTITDPGTRLPAPLYQVKGKDGTAMGGRTEQKDGVLTITVDADFASLTGYLGGLQALCAQGIDTIVFVTNGAASTFALADLLASMTAGDSYTLTHDGSTVTFTLSNGTDISGILK